MCGRSRGGPATTAQAVDPLAVEQDLAGVGRIVPPIRLKTVVLPEPFGPISAVIEPSGTVNQQSSTAWAAEALLQTATSSSGGPSRRALGRRRGALEQIEPGAEGPPCRACGAPRAARPRSGRMPCGRNSTTSTIRPPNRSSRALPPPNALLANSFSGSMRNAPSTGPHSVPRPPSITDSTICTLSRMLNMPSGSTNDR